jgi:hypothetical protein
MKCTQDLRADTPPMYPPNMILHVVHATEHSVTTIPLADNPRIVLGLMARSILLAREAALFGLGAPLMATEEALGVAVEMLAQVTATREDGL